MANQQWPRLKAICVIRHGRSYLFSVGTDPAKPETFLVPLGGGVEFGETASASVVREIKEEIGVVIEKPYLLGVLENIFNYDGAAHHEVVFVSSCRSLTGIKCRSRGGKATERTFHCAGSPWKSCGRLRFQSILKA